MTPELIMVHYLSYIMGFIIDNYANSMAYVYEPESCRDLKGLNPWKEPTCLEAGVTA